MQSNQPRHEPNEQLLRAAFKLQHQAAPLTTLALGVVNDRIAGIDGRPVSAWGAEGSRSSDTTSSTERAAIRRVDLARETREELRDRRDGILISIDNYIRFCREIVASGSPVDRPVAVLCGDYAALDMRPWEGHHLAWTPHSRDQRNGWQDPTCRQAAGRSGLCPRCLQRMNRWRRDNGLHWVSDAPDHRAS